LTQERASAHAAFAVELRSVTKRFGTLTANDSVTVRVRTGEIHAVIGENGAGKSTALAMLFGLQAPDEGTVAIDGVERTLAGPRDAIALGLGMVHQHFSLVPQLTVAENVVLGAEPRRGLWLDRAAAARAVEEIAAPFGLAIDPARRVSDLSVGEAQWVELLKALHRGARTLLLDEPTAVLTPHEVERLLDALKLLRSEGRTVVLVTHKLAEVLSAADSVTVMRAGRSVLETAVSATSRDDLARAMIGRAPAPPPRRHDTPEGAPVTLETRDLVVERHGRRVVDGVSLRVRGGEVLGIAGVEGNGQTELLEAVAGLVPVASGGVTLASGLSRDAIGFVPGDRRKHGLVLDMTVEENAILGRHTEPQFTGAVLTKASAIESHARSLIERFDIRPPSPDAVAATLSGGNQQKIVVARELEAGERLLLIAQPTRGVDLGAVETIHAALRDARDRGAAILLVSSDLDEILGLSDRVVVMFRGRVVGEVDPHRTTPTELGLLMTTGSAEAAV
jgi:simple sugar transport system ATP-binding protein